MPMSDETGVPVNIAIGDPTLGAWCPHCAVSMCGTFPILLLSMDGVTRLGSMTLCIRCGAGVPVAPE